DRAHLWRGIHDPAMVASGLTPRIDADAEKARFELTNSGGGHAFPTYAVPTVVMSAVALEPSGSPALRDRPAPAMIARRDKSAKFRGHFAMKHRERRQALGFAGGAEDHHPRHRAGCCDAQSVAGPGRK